MSVSVKNRLFELNKAEIRDAEYVLSQYPIFDALEQRRRTELNQRVVYDENIGGSRGTVTSNHGHENDVIKVAEDRIIDKIKHNRVVIKEALEQLDTSQKIVVEMSYFQKFNKPTADRIAAAACMGRTSVFRFKKDFITYIYPRLKL